MNWEALGAIGELVGAVSVLLTLIYLARQIKENTKVQTISAYSSMMDGFEALHSCLERFYERASSNKLEYVLRRYT